MINEKNILTRIRAAENSPAGAYAVEVPSNRYLTGNLLSQHEYSQTKEEDNGYGDTGSSTTGELNKFANVYLEKIASMKGWAKDLARNIREAEPLTQVGIGLGTVIGAGKAKAGYDNMTSHKHHATMEERSLKTLQAINRNLSKVTIPPKNP